jgi:Flp pilus assembly protein TadG
VEAVVRGRVLRRLRLLFARDQGAQIAEFAAVVPMLVMMIFGILWFGRAFNIYTTVNRATRSAAEAAALHTCATCGNGTTSRDDILTNVVDPILAASHLAPPDNADFDVVPTTLTLPSGSTVTIYVAHLNYPYNVKLNGITCCPPALTPVTMGVTIRARAQSQEEN